MVRACPKLAATSLARMQNRMPRVRVQYSRGDKGNRTPNLFHAMEARYQLRHIPVVSQECELYRTVTCSRAAARTSQKALIGRT